MDPRLQPAFLISDGFLTRGGRMNHVSVSTRLYFLCFFLIGCMTVISGVSVWGLHAQQKHTHHIADIELPAIHNMTLADMMHDGIRAAAYHSLILIRVGTPKEREAAVEEYKGMADDLKKYLDTLDHLELRAETKAAISAARPEVDHYVEEGRQLVDLATAGKVEEAFARIPQFQESFEKLESKLDTLSKNIEADSDGVAADGDKGIQINVTLTAIFILLGVAFSILSVRALIRSLRTQLKTLLDERSGVTESAQAVNQLANQLTESSAEQSSALDQTASSLTQIDAMVKRNAADATQAKDISDRSAKVAQDGKRSVEDMLQAIQDMQENSGRIFEQIERTNQQISEMITRFQEIGQKTQVINDIVFQTRLLSFNASVEAARAGEHGKGFAVVAEEVGSLASMSGEAAKEISHLLQTNTTWVNQMAEQSRSQISTLLTETRQKLERGTSVARECERLLEEVVRNTQDVTERSNSIAVASAEQSQGVSEINKAISTLVHLSARNTKLSKDAAGSAGQLSSSSGALSNVIHELNRVLEGSKAS